MSKIKLHIYATRSAAYHHAAALGVRARAVYRNPENPIEWIVEERVYEERGGDTVVTSKTAAMDAKTEKFSRHPLQIAK